MGIGRGGPPKPPAGLGPPEPGPPMPAAAGGGGPDMPPCKHIHANKVHRAGMLAVTTSVCHVLLLTAIHTSRRLLVCVDTGRCACIHTVLAACCQLTGGPGGPPRDICCIPAAACWGPKPGAPGIPGMPGGPGGAPSGPGGRIMPPEGPFATAVMLPGCIPYCPAGRQAKVVQAFIG